MRNAKIIDHHPRLRPVILEHSRQRGLGVGPNACEAGAALLVNGGVIGSAPFEWRRRGYCYRGGVHSNTAMKMLARMPIDVPPQSMKTAAARMRIMRVAPAGAFAPRAMRSPLQCPRR